jgi:hypothetical protein
MVATRRARLRRARDRHELEFLVHFFRRAAFWHNGRLSAVRPTYKGACAAGHTREAKPDPGILPGSLNCSVTHTGEIAQPWL